MTSGSISEADPMTTWARLEQDETALLLDVRTQAEWSFVGVPTTPANRPSLVLIEWQEFPAMKINPTFAEAALTAAEEAGATTVFFICRSGVRSLHAAVATEAAAHAKGRALTCVNVVGGFEGDPDPEGHRGVVNGWKAQGLPWRQT